MPAVAERFKVRTRQTASRFQRVGSKIIKKTLQGTGVEWRGFHAFRRGLGTRLYNNGTPIETVAKVLRHGSGSEVTLKYYVEVEEETKAAALQSLPRKIKRAQRNQILLTSASHSGRKTVFMHRPDDDDSSAVTSWNTNMNDLQDLFASALKAIEERQLRNPKVLQGYSQSIWRGAIKLRGSKMLVSNCRVRL